MIVENGSGRKIRVTVWECSSGQKSVTEQAFAADNGSEVRGECTACGVEFCVRTGFLGYIINTDADIVNCGGDTSENLNS